MNELTITGGAKIVEQQTINADLFARWTSYTSNGQHKSEYIRMWQSG